MSCNNIVKILPLPECIEEVAYNPYYMEGLNFVDADTNMIAKVRDVATGKTYPPIDFTTDVDGDAVIDIYELFPLMNHIYTMEFVNKETGNPETFVITNDDATTCTGCSIQFGVNIGMTDNNGFFYVSCQECAV